MFIELFREGLARLSLRIPTITLLTVLVTRIYDATFSICSASRKIQHYLFISLKSTLISANVVEKMIVLDDYSYYYYYKSESKWKYKSELHAVCIIYIKKFSNDIQKKAKPSVNFKTELTKWKLSFLSLLRAKSNTIKIIVSIMIQIENIFSNLNSVRTSLLQNREFR